MVSVKKVIGSEPRPRIVLGVTSDISLSLLAGFPTHLEASGWDVHVVCAPGASASMFVPSRFVTLHTIDMVRSPSLMRDVRSLLRWMSLLRDLKPDLLSVGTPKAGLLGVLAAWLLGQGRRIYMLRGLRMETEAGLRRLMLWCSEKVALLLASRVLAVSPSLRERVVQLNLAPSSKVDVLGLGSSNGVEFERFDSLDEEVVNSLRRDLNLGGATPIVGFVGRLVRDKGLVELLGAHRALLSRRVPHKLLIVGSIDDEPEVANLFDAQEADQIVVTGHVPDVAPYFALMDVFCLPTHREGFPNVVLEASSASIPTVTTDATGAVDSVLDKETGRIVKVGSTEQLSNALQELVMDRRLALEYGKNALEWVKVNYARKDVWARTEKYYRALIEQ
ncbi:glycosyltransferase family 4 protein [Paramicrobacterium agarici]|uniref:glycosyltransferase family 4 protein n=1 Tax=Paramicrobacterium agarici TaxID=630514 RepID=UPI00114F9DAE|nr:glycosyltransferase family 4 protein [Microbacterium agarici]TQO23691.1 glycosyltransferase involved in cell wall biosynthesis [Microbacterium agarici]